jgi:hypothetical protein
LKDLIEAIHSYSLLPAVLDVKTVHTHTHTHAHTHTKGENRFENTVLKRIHAQEILSRSGGAIKYEQLYSVVITKCYCAAKS